MELLSVDVWIDPITETFQTSLGVHFHHRNFIETNSNNLKYIGL